MLIYVYIQFFIIVYIMNNIKNNKNSKNIHYNLNWKNWGNRKYMNSTLVENQVNLYKSLFLLYNIKSTHMSLLEIGAGHGDYTLVFEKLFKKITAIDPSPVQGCVFTIGL